MSKIECRAKNRSECKFHSWNAYKYAAQNVEMWEGYSKSAGSHEKHETYQDRVNHYRLLMDSTPKGFKRVRKALDRAVKVGDFEKQAVLSERLRAASQNLAEKDGYVNEFRQAEIDGGMFGYTTLVLKKGAEDDVVETPRGNGTMWFAEVADRVAAEPDYEVRDIDLIFFQAKPEIEEAEQAEIRSRLLAVAQKGGLIDWMESTRHLDWDDGGGISRDNFVGIHGITYSEPSGRNVVVRAAEGPDS